MSTEESGPVSVPATVFVGLQRYLEESPEAMLEIKTVLRWLRDEGCYATADWIELNQDTYLNAATRRGFKPDKE